MEFLLILIILIALVAAFFLQQSSRAHQAKTGLPIDAQVVYSDTGAWECVERPLFSRKFRLTGKPDYIVRQDSGALIPIEVKPNRTAPKPRFSDVMQLTAYAVLIQETYGDRPAYGLLKYRDHVFRIDLTEELQTELFEVLSEMRAARRAQNVPRSHDDPTICKYCGYRDACDERLE